MDAGALSLGANRVLILLSLAMLLEITSVHALVLAS
jgi:hypothetical protein